MTKEQKQLFRPLVIAFVLVNGLAIPFRPALEKAGMDPSVILGANLLLFLISALSLTMQIKSVNNKNPHAMVRGVMGSMVLKLFALGAAAFFYLYAAGENKSVNALFVSMGLYIVYTWLEVRVALRLNPKTNAGN